ncbi:MAG: hypothetical protein ACLVJ6_01155 [Merdibacter sp.]
MDELNAIPGQSFARLCERQAGSARWETVIIGDGSSVVAQYPSAGETITSNDRLLL